MDVLKNTNYFLESDITISYIHSMIWDKMDKAWTYHPGDNILYRILYVCEGEYLAYIGDDRVHVSEKDILYIPRRFSYDSKSISQKFSYISVFFDITGETVSNGFFNEYHILKNAQKLRHKFENIYNEYNSKVFGYKLSTKNILYDILKNLLVEKMLKDDSFVGYYTIMNAINYIGSNYSNENISIDYLANLCNITPTYFIRLFKEIYMTTPKNYIIELRIAKAKELLQYSSYSISEISAQLGYSDPAYFSAAFKNFAGVSPMKFRHGSSY